jgi:dTDP-4-amino-4,6-dideoxygalactose transaminase
MNLANDRGIQVIEDAAQAHGARYEGRRAGTFGIAGCFSFYPGKNLGAFGEAGAVVTSDSKLADRIRLLLDHGQARKYVHEVPGWNCRMDGIQAAVLQIKLRRLEQNNRRRQQHAERYADLLKDVPNVILPASHPDRTHIYHIYGIRVPHRHRFMDRLNSLGIGCGIHYPIPIHLQRAYADLGHDDGSFPVAERCASEFVSLPMYPELGVDQINLVARAVATASSSSLAA